MDEALKQTAAYHEAGHAVIGRLLNLVCREATIIGDEGILGYAHVEDPLQRWERGDGPRRPLADAFCIALYAGAEAERAILGSDGVGDGEDGDRATGCLKDIGVRGAQYVSDDIWERYEARLRARARQLVMLHHVTIERVALALFVRGRLEADEIDALIGL